MIEPSALAALADEVWKCNEEARGKVILQPLIVAEGVSLGYRHTSDTGRKLSWVHVVSWAEIEYAWHQETFLRDRVRESQQRFAQEIAKQKERAA